MENNYPKAYKEVLEVLKYVPKESVDKIPQTMIDTFNAKMDTSYDFSIDINKSFEEQNLLEETKAILANIFRDFWATPEQKERIMAKERFDLQQIEEEKKIKYAHIGFRCKDKIEETDDEFIDEIKDDDNNKNVQNNELPVEVRKESFYEKIIIFFKKLFHIN